MKPDLQSRLLADKQKLGAVVAGLLATVCAIYLSSNLYQDINIVNTPVGTQTQNTADLTQKATVSIETLTSAHLFGISQSAASEHHPTQTHVPETRLGLELRGVFGSSIAQDGRALIAEKGKSAKYYAVNDKLPGGAVLDSVATNNVVLSRGGRLETLSFTPSNLTASNFSASDTANNPATLPSPASTQSLAIEREAQEKEQRTASLKDRLKQLRETRDL